MNGLREFLAQLLPELRRSLGETFGLFGRDAEELTVALAELISRLVVAVLIVLLLFGIYIILRSTVRFLLARFGLRSDLSRPLVHALRYTFVVFSVLAVMAQFGVPQELSASVARAAVAAFIFYVGLVLAVRLLAGLMQRYKIDSSLSQLLSNVVTVVIAAFGFATVLAQFGVEILSVVAGLGIAGIAVGFAAQETLSNFIAGITLLLERPFHIGDWVEIAGQVGRVDTISLRTTRLMTRENVMMVMPNSKVASSEIKDFSSGGPLRVTIPVGIAYKESAEAARRVMLPILRTHPAVLTRPEPEVWLVELGDSSVNLWLLYWLAPESIGRLPKVSAEILEGCKEALDDAGIQIPFPHLQLFIDDASGLKPISEPFLAHRRRPDKESRANREGA